MDDKKNYSRRNPGEINHNNVILLHIIYLKKYIYHEALLSLKSYRRHSIFIEIRLLLFVTCPTECSLH
jgi:hypothetical protein